MKVKGNPETLPEAVAKSVEGLVTEGKVIAEVAGLTVPVTEAPAAPVTMVFVHPGPGPQEVPGLGVFEPGEKRAFPDQAAADAAYETGWFAPPGGKSKRQLLYEQLAAQPANQEVTT